MLRTPLMIDVYATPALKDNYIWLIRRGDAVVVVDPGDAIVVKQTLQSMKLHLTGIIITHHHWDHVNGVDPLVSQYEVPVYGPRRETIPRCSVALDDGDEIDLPEIGLSFSILGVPGHTLGAIAYYGGGLLFSGDTLFTAGCGRLFEGTPHEMYSSLQRLSALPPDTLLYCGHEYTLPNLAFAQMVEPDNTEIAIRIADAKASRARGIATVPATMHLEQQTNPFLRCTQPAIRAAAERFSKQKLSSGVEVFRTLRGWKDNI